MRGAGATALRQKRQRRADGLGYRVGRQAVAGYWAGDVAGDLAPPGDSLATLRGQWDSRRVRSRGGPGWAVLALLAALCVLGAAAVPAEGADRLVATDVGAGIDAFLGTFAWTDPVTYDRLVLFSDGERRFAPARLQHWPSGCQPRT
jgi:hypothetical protein